MGTFHYVRPGTLKEVCALLSEHGSDASLLSGGTDLLVRIRIGKAVPRVVIDLKKVNELQGTVDESSSGLRIGALTKLSDISEDFRVLCRFPALAEAAGSIGSVQIRNRATLAGNICNASPAADTAPALLVYDAIVNIVGPRGRRFVLAADFFRGPGQTVLERGELVESVELPFPTEPVGASFVRLTRRRGVDLATVNVACLVTKSGQTRFAFGAVGPRPFPVSDDSGLLADPQADPGARDALVQQLTSEARPISDVRASQEYRQAMLLVLSRRGLAAAQQRLFDQGVAIR